MLGTISGIIDTIAQALTSVFDSIVGSITGDNGEG